MRKNIIRGSFAAVAITGALLVLGSGDKPTPPYQPCKESMEQCCKKKNNGGSMDNMVRETLSGQFFTRSGLN